MGQPRTDPTYQIAPRNRFFDANLAIVEYEVRQIVGVTFFAEVDLTEVERVRAAAPTRKPSYTAFVAKAVARALREFPYPNGRVCRRWWLPFSRARLQQFTHCDVAIACERNLPGMEAVAFADILRDADHLSLEQITDWLHELSVCDPDTNKQWRDFTRIIRWLPRWLSNLLIRLPCFFPSFWVKYRGGAALISSPAKYGVDGVAATWCWPLGFSFGIVKQRPVVRDDRVLPCPTFTLTLTFDRRLMAGAQAARFLKRIVDLLEHAETELALSPAAERVLSTEPLPQSEVEKGMTPAGQGIGVP
jgi:hypothetical protein